MIFFVGFVVLAGMFIPFHFSRVIADIAVDFLAALPYFAARRIVVAKLFLRCDFVFLRTTLMPVGNRRERMESASTRFQEIGGCRSGQHTAQR